ncbi:hypothetical protein BU24DRAFT_465111 [Aaosphaeria arxii CBS 175.79]|uniref:Uncharacterized protein n=1 Tax=Aaosphaeria arxii CBS 175.79 TaxID=1450172 RepID=A0A6A5XIR6_9PLEO|nr:uncharacterized protein BU24DRAFT_465111 [Aaosphaeria arxii CBS 175.79]KAF2012749.1 hypothetical protein BU24DRAFT_465111 [Aaosphaeria arxii CBS 175.79]
MANGSGPIHKTIAIIGAGGDATTGSLIYMLGGIDLIMLGKLQEKGIDSYADAARELKNTNKELYFYTPRHRITVQGLPSIAHQLLKADGLILVVTPPSQASDSFFVKSTTDQLKDSVTFFAQKKAAVFVRTSNDFRWSESVYNQLVENLGAKLQELDIPTEGIPIIPSIQRNENIIELSPNTPWYTKPTLVSALDEILS